MEAVVGLEPTYPCGSHFQRVMCLPFHHTAINLEGALGIEPRLRGSKPLELPLHHTPPEKCILSGRLDSNQRPRSSKDPMQTRLHHAQTIYTTFCYLEPHERVERSLSASKAKVRIPRMGHCLVHRGGIEPQPKGR